MEDHDKIEMLHTMRLIREFESEVKTRFEDNEIPGFVHLYIGEEAIATGVCQALTEEDYITSTHRGHGHCLAMGLEPERMMAELYAKETGYNHGKGGSMHIADVDAGMLGANGIVGAGVPIAAGAALSADVLGEDHVAVSFFGDGALSQGAFHEAMHLAGLWDLPFVAVIENNQYGEMTGINEHHPESITDDLTVFADPHGIHAEQIDGMDVETVYDTAAAAIDRARSGEGPTLIECETYRYEGHHEGDTQFYRDDEEVERWRKRDPLRTYPKQLQEEGVLTEDEIEEMTSEIQQQVAEAVTFAQESDYPDPADAYTGLYSEEV